MTPEQFRALVLSKPGVSEGSHRSHPDFRVGGTIIATLGYPNERWGMVKLRPDQQDAFVSAHPGAFEPAGGSWGRQGSTLVKLEQVEHAVASSAVAAAWENAAA